jgi:hypothetical protein
LGAGTVGAGPLWKICVAGGADEACRLEPQREQKVLVAAFAFPQLGQYLVAGCVGTWLA